MLCSFLSNCLLSSTHAPPVTLSYPTLSTVGHTCGPGHDHADHHETLATRGGSSSVQHEPWGPWRCYLQPDWWTRRPDQGTERGETAEMRHLLVKYYYRTNAHAQSEKYVLSMFDIRHTRTWLNNASFCHSVTYYFWSHVVTWCIILWSNSLKFSNLIMWSAVNILSVNINSIKIINNFFVVITWMLMLTWIHEVVSK